MATLQQIQVQNNTFLDMLDSGGTLRKQAESDANDYIRYQLREESFARKIIPVEDAGDTFDRAIWTDKPIKIYDKELGQSQAVVIGYNAQPIHFYIQPGRFAVTPTMIRSPKIQKSKWELRTYRYDVRQVMADNMVKDVQAQEDSALLFAVNTALGAVNSNMPLSGVPQYKQVSGGFSRDSVVTACFQIQQKTMFNIPVETNVVNHITWAERLRWDLIEAGGFLSERMLTKPYENYNFFDANWLVTIKRGLVNDLTQYMFGPTKFIGKTCQFTPPTLATKMENIGVYEFQVYQEIGSTLAHTGAFSRADYLSN